GLVIRGRKRDGKHKAGQQEQTKRVEHFSYCNLSLPAQAIDGSERLLPSFETENPKPLSERESARVAIGMEAAAVVFCSILYFAVAFAIAGSRLLWYDELFTLRVLEQGTFRRMLEALREGLDLQPIGFYVVTMLTQRLGEDEIS